MTEHLRVLYVDDSPFDRELVRDALKVEPDSFELVEAPSRHAFESCLGDGYDIVLSDFNILGFEGLQVLEAVKTSCPGVPVVIVTGTGSEEVAVEAMKRGAYDYVIKTPKHIQRLPHTLRAVVEYVKAEEERQRATRERDLLFARSRDMLAIFTYDGSVLQANPAWEQTLGWTPEDLATKSYSDLTHPDDLASTTDAIQRLLAGEHVVSYENRTKCKSGEYRWLSWDASTMEDEKLVFTVTRDVTAKKAAEARIEHQMHQLAALHDIDKAMTADLDLECVLNTLLEHSVEELGVDAASILLYDANNELLEFAAGHGFDSEAVRTARMRMSEGYAGDAVITRRVIHCTNLLDSADDQNASEASKGVVVEYYGAPLVAKGNLKGVLEVFNEGELEPDEDRITFLEMLAEQAAIAIAAAQLVEELRESNDDLALAYGATIEGWSGALHLRDRETAGHTRRVTEMTLRLARAMGESEAELVHVRRGALLHDIGKLGVPDSILLKPSSLDEDEWEQMRSHPKLAHDMLSPIGYLQSALDIPYCHHEKWDGTGYPRGLKGSEIPRAARIFAVVDVWDALCSDRPYRSAWRRTEALEYIREQSGKHFDPEVVAAFERMLARDEATEER